LPLLQASRIASPESANILLLEIQALLLLGKVAEVNSTISNLDLTVLEGRASECMKIAHIINRYGQRETALDFGYHIICKNENDPDSELLYCGLFLGEAEGSNDLLNINTIRDGVWVRIVDQNNESDDFIIDSSLPNSSKIVHPDHDRARPFIGKRLGDEVEVSKQFIEPRRWRITEIKHRYVHVLHHIMETFNNRHPYHSGMQKVVFQDDNIQPLLDMIRKRSEDADVIGKIYDSNSVPVTMVGSRTGGDAIDFLEFVESRPQGIRTNSGTNQEQIDSCELVINGSGRGAVLDITALWTVLRLDTLAILESVFGSLRVATSTVNEIRHIRERLNDQLGQKSGMAAYRDGHYYLVENNDSKTQSQLGLIDGYLQQIDNLMTVVPAVLPHEMKSSFVDILTDEQHPHLIDPILVSAESQAILISEDLDFRNVGAAISKISSTWLQPVFRHALNENLIDASRHAELTVRLAALGHGHVSLDASTLVVIANERPSELKWVADFIGIKNAEINSHVRVVAEFAANYWRGPNVSRSNRKAMSLILGKLIRFRTTDWHRCFAVIALSAPDGKGMLRYLLKWSTNRGLKTRPLKRLYVILEARRRSNLKQGIAS
jgi:cellulose synthase operon protein C